MSSTRSRIHEIVNIFNVFTYTTVPSTLSLLGSLSTFSCISSYHVGHIEWEFCFALIMCIPIPHQKINSIYDYFCARVCAHNVIIKFCSFRHVLIDVWRWELYHWIWKFTNLSAILGSFAYTNFVLQCRAQDPVFMRLWTNSMYWNTAESPTQIHFLVYSRRFRA